MALLNVQEINYKGSEISYSTADSSGDTFTNDGKTRLHIKNGGTDVNVTIKTQKDSLVVGGYGVIDLVDEVITVSANTEYVVGVFPRSRFNNSFGQVEVTYDDTSNVEVAVISYE